jgi:hypothetical protein
MRDAMSLLDQVIAFSGNKLTGADVTRVLGVADRKILHELGAALVSGDAAACLGVVERLAQQGFDLPHVAKDVLAYLRNLVVAKVCLAPAGSAGPSLKELLDLADEEVEDVVDLASRAEVEDLSRLFQGFSRAFDDVVRSGHPRMSLEMAFVRLARRPPLLPLDELLTRIGDLERRLGGAPPPGQGPVPRGGGGGGGRATHASSAPIHASPPGDTRPPRTHGTLALVDPAPPRASPVAAPVIADAVDPAAATDIAAWYAIVERLRLEQPPLASVVEHAIPIEVGATRVRLGFEATAGFLAGRASEPAALEALTRAIRAHFGAPTQVALELSAKPVPGIRTVASIEAERRSAELAKARAAVHDHPVVKEAIRLFGAQVRDVKLPSSEG